VKKLKSRVPEVALIFWIIKILSTTVGETGADFLAETMGFGMPYVALVISALMAALLFIQFAKIKRYVPEIYWSLVVLMSIVGTLITDILVDIMGVGLITLSIIFTISMAVGFMVWYKKENTISIHSIDTSQREAYYWVVILLAFALGTAIGDLISEGIAVGYGLSLLLFIGLISLVAFEYYILRTNSIQSFWLAFILTRPLGASLGDFLTQPSSAGGLAINMLVINCLFFALILGLVGYLGVKQKQLAH